MTDQLETMMMHLLENLLDNPFAIAITMVALVFVYLFWKNDDLDWTDMITNKGSRTVSLTKMLQLVGGIIGSWIMVKTTVQGKLTSDLFWIYLTYVGAIEGWSKFISAKYGINNTPKVPNVEQPPKES
jgi:hypothetical protein